ncbi:Permease of the drug/metabolite transporter (DMT) superfamily [Burkholderia singularis]|uniref:Permease of the drug/metabolite transporter (DMT) superfamily n=1 Tax=Burkholderia singularis TaxID=1503053 RepID=A0A238H6S9_9BURK|nr:Permease of the drug/metabolite transporter (DMT) superfamily [Burkholderia singularis]
MNKSPFLFPFCAIALWAGNVVVSKLSASTIDPSAITFYRLLLAVALMSVFTLCPA